MTWARTENLLIGLPTAAALLLSGVLIASRYLLPSLYPDWGDEVIIYLVVWSIWLSTGGLVRNNEHVKADLLLRILPTASVHWLEKINTLLGLLFCSLMALGGTQVVALAVKLNEQSASSLHLPLWVYYLSIVVGTLLMAVQYLLQLLGKKESGQEELKQ